MSIGILRRWSDPGAPKLWANQYGSFANLLKAVLVDGYGIYPSLGWSLEYESPDLNVKAFRNNPYLGSGIYFQADHSNRMAIARNFVRLAFFESMTDWDSGVLRTPPLGASCFWPIGASVGSSCDDGIHWMVIGDDRGFWFAWRPNLSNNFSIYSSLLARSWLLCFVGDIIPAHPGHPFPCFFYGNVTDSLTYSFGYSSNFKSVNSLYFLVRGSSFKPGSVNVGLSSGSSYEQSYMGSSPDISPFYGRTLLSTISVHDSEKFIGFLPGARNPLRASGIEEGADFDEEFVKADKTLHILLYRYGTSTTGRRFGLISGEGFRDVF